MAGASLGDQRRKQERQSIDAGLKRNNAVRRKSREISVKDNFKAASIPSDGFPTGTLGAAPPDTDTTVLNSLAARYAATEAASQAPPALVRCTFDAYSVASSTYGESGAEEANFPWIGTCHFAHILKPRKVTIDAPLLTLNRGPGFASRCTGETGCGVSEWERLYDAVSRAEAQAVAHKTSKNLTALWSPRGTYIPQGIPKGRVAKFVETGLEVDSEQSNLVTEKAVLFVETPAEGSRRVRDRLRGLWKRAENAMTDSTSSLIMGLKAERREYKAVVSCLPGGK